MRPTPIAFVIAACLALPAHAQDTPTRPIRIVVPFAAGGGTDLLARFFAQRLNEWYGQPATVDNRPGAGGNIGTEIVARSAPDGLTALFSSASMAVNATLYPKLPFSIQKDFIAVSQAAASPLIFAVHPSVPAKNVKELIALSKQRKGGVNFGSNGNGTTSHLSGLLLNQVAGIELTHIPYKGAGPAINALMAGEIDMGFMAAFSAMPHVKSGRFRALAVTTKRRSPALPDVPTLDSIYPGFETDNWFALLLPAGTPAGIVKRYHADMVKALQHPDMRNFITREGGYPIGNSPEEFTKALRADIEKYAKLVKSSGAKPDQ